MLRKVTVVGVLLAFVGLGLAFVSQKSLAERNASPFGTPDSSAITRLLDDKETGKRRVKKIDTELGKYTPEQIADMESVEPMRRGDKTPPDLSRGIHEANILTIVLDFNGTAQPNTTDEIGNVVGDFDVTAYGFTAGDFNLVTNAILAEVREDYFTELQGTVAGPAGQDLEIDFIIGDIGTAPPGLTNYYYLQIGDGISGPDVNPGQFGVALTSSIRNSAGAGPNFGFVVGDVLGSIFTDEINLLNVTPSNALTSANLEFTTFAISGTLSHEAGHALSLSHLSKAGSVQPTAVPPIMGTGAIDLPGQDRIGERNFSLSGVDGQDGNAPRQHIQQLVDAIGLHGAGADTTTAVISAPSPSDLGQNVTFTATVTSGGPVTTGSVTFIEGGTCAAPATNFGTFNVNGSGQASFSTNSLTLGSHIIRACYGATMAFNASDGTVTHVVRQPTSTSITTSNNPAVFATNVTFTASVLTTPGNVAVTTGTVSFYDGGASCAAPGTPIGGAVMLNGAGQASVTTNTLTIGTHTIRACYNGATNFSPSGASLTQTILNPIFTYNASANPSVNQYTLIVNGLNYEIRNTQTGAVLASQPVAGTTQIIVNGENGDFDILTVNFSGGNITIPVTYNGGTGGPDSMNTLGGTFAGCISTPSSANNGTLVCTGGSSAGSNITYTGLEPINDANVVANYTINGTAGVNNIAVINGPGGTVQVNSGVPATFELINFTNKTNVIIDSLAGADVTTVNFSIVPNALSSIRVNTGNEQDITNILSLPTTVTLNVDGQAGGGFTSDETVIGNSFALINQQDGSLLNINGTINLTAATEMNLHVDNSGDLNGRTFSTAAIGAVPVFGGAGYSFTRSGAPSVISATAGVDLVFVYGGKGADTFNVGAAPASPAGGGSLWLGNSGDDIFNITGSGLGGAQNAQFFGGPGSDIFNVSPKINGSATPITILGDAPTTFPGDSINVNQTGVTGGVLAIGANGNGSFTSTSHQTINIQGIEVQAPTTTTIAATAATTYGANVTFTATVATQMPGTGSPTGTVSFLADGSPIAGCTTVAVTAVPTTTATASCTTNTLAAGVRAISAVFTPTGTYYQTSTGTSNHTVNKAVLTVTADNQARAYGAANPTLTATITGFVLSQNLGTSGVTGTPTLATTATPTSPVGAYPITATIGTLAAANYSFTFVNGTLTVNQAVITVTGDNKSRVFGAPNPALTVTYTGFANGETFANSGITGAPGISTTATQSSPVGSYPITVTTNTLAAANYSFTLVNGTLTIGQAATTTTITNAGSLGNPTVGVPYAVNFTVAPVAPSTGTPTGTVTVSDGTGATCTASVAAGTCNLTSTTPGPKTITATYPGDTNFTGSSSLTIPVNVFIAMTGNVKQHVAFGTNTNLAGVTLTLTNTTSNSVVGQATSDASGNYSFGVLSAGGNYRIIPSGLGKTYEAENRSYTNVVGNIAGADFVAYDVPGPNANPRGARVTNQTTTPGQSVTVPIVMAKVGNEARIAFSIDYAAGVLGVPTITCGTGEPGCTVVVNNSLAGRAGVTITPAGGTFNAGVTEIARVTFPTFATTLTSTPIRFGDFPTARDVRNADNNPLPTLYWTDGTVSFTSSTVLDGATVSGRVTTAAGQPVRNATVVITDTAGTRRTATTSSFGTYVFEGIGTGGTYVITVTSRRYRFTSRVVNVTESLTDINFTGQE